MWLIEKHTALYYAAYSKDTRELQHDKFNDFWFSFLIQFDLYIVFDTSGYLQHFFHWAFTVFSWCLLLHWLFHLCLLLCWILLISVTFQFLCDPGFSPWISSLTILLSLVILGCLIIFSTIYMLVTPSLCFQSRCLFERQISNGLWIIYIANLKYQNWTPTFPPNLIFFAFFYISKNRIVFPIFEAQNFRIILFLFLWFTLHIHLTSDPVDSTFRISPQTNHSALSSQYTLRLFWCELLQWLLTCFHISTCVLLLSIFNLESIKTDCSKPSTQSESQLLPVVCEATDNSMPSAAAWPPVSSPSSSCLHSDPAL